MSGVARVTEPGMQTTLQDLGRRHMGALGVSPSGAVDPLAARAANAIVGNDPRAPVLETTLSGVALTPSRDCVVAACGATAELRVGGDVTAMWRATQVRAGQEIQVGRAQRGARTYVAIDGGFVGEAFFGSESTDVAAGFGGVAGRRLRAGDEIGLGPAATSVRSRAGEPPERVLERPAVLRVLPGPHPHADRSRRMLTHVYRMSSQSNRQALRLDGDPAPNEGGSDVAPLGVAAGFVQLTSAGLPIVLLAEHQATGGYAVPWCVITADLTIAAQLAPGDEVRFAAVSRAAAALALSRQEAWLWELANTPAR